jgi:hypothetical protein
MKTTSTTIYSTSMELRVQSHKVIEVKEPFRATASSPFQTAADPSSLPNRDCSILNYPAPGLKQRLRSRTLLPSVLPVLLPLSASPSPYTFYGLRFRLRLHCSYLSLSRLSPPGISSPTSSRRTMFASSIGMSHSEDSDEATQSGQAHQHKDTPWNDIRRVTTKMPSFFKMTTEK